MPSDALTQTLISNARLMIRSYQHQLENLALEERAKGADAADIQSRRAHIESEIEIATKTIELNRLRSSGRESRDGRALG
jgi:hypothetical protein